MEDQLFTAILNDTYTARKMQKRLRVLKSYLLKTIYQTAGEQIDQMEMTEEQDWFNALDKQLLGQITKDTITPLFVALEKKITEMQLLTIYIAFDIPMEELTRLGKRLRVDYGNNFLFDIKFDPNVIAGAALVSKGIYKDYSVRSLIGQNKDQVLTTFRNFVGRAN